MYVPKAAAGIIISGITAVSLIFPSNSFAHKFVSEYIFPTTKPIPSISPKPHTKKNNIPVVTPTVTPIPIVPTHAAAQVTIMPTQQPTIVQSEPTKIPTPTQNPPTTSAPAPTNDAQAFIMNAINDYRHTQGLGSVQMNSSTCSFAATRAQEITTSFSHDGFTSRVNNHTLPYSGYSFVTENLAQTGSYKDVVNMWIASPGHAENLRADTPYVCVVQNGEYFAMEGLRP